MSLRRNMIALGLPAFLPWAGSAAAAEPRLLAWRGYAPKNLLEKLEKETGIKVQVTFTNNGEMIARQCLNQDPSRVRQPVVLRVGRQGVLSVNSRFHRCQPAPRKRTINAAPRAFGEIFHLSTEVRHERVP